VIKKSKVAKYWYVPTGNQVWFDVALDLYERGVAEPVLWLGDDCHYKTAKNKFSDAVLRRNTYIFYPERISNVDYSGVNSDFFLSINYLRAKDRCFKMMDRLDLYGLYNRLDREVIFNKLCAWALMQFEKTRPDALVFSEAPHSHTYYLLYEICRYFNIPIVKFNTWLPVPLVFMQDAVTGERFFKNNFRSVKSQSLVDEAVRFVRNLARSDSVRYELPAMKIQKNEIKILNQLIYFFRVGFLLSVKECFFQFRMYFSSFYYPINPYRIGFLTRAKIKRRRRLNISKAFQYNCKAVELSEKYVYFALHYEPERTTNPDGDKFHDQAIALAKLRNMVPTEYSIFVKEHPTHLYRADKGVRGRSPLLYDYISNIVGVTLVPKDLDSLDLIKNSSLVASISGSAVFEAAVLGKPSIKFGDAWFNECPNVFSWHQELDFKEILNKEVRTVDDVVEYLFHLEKNYSVPGCQNPSAQLKFGQYLDENFSNQEFAGIAYLLENFFKGLKRR
jgi:hypothetical protein